MFSPRSLFLIPGAMLALLGLCGMVWLLPEARYIGRIRLDIHSLLYAALALVVGTQSMLFWLFAQIYGAREGIVLPDSRPWFQAIIRAARLEWMLIAAGILLLVGLALAVFALGVWTQFGFGDLSPDRTMRLVIPSATAVLLAFNLAYSGFFISILQVRSRKSGVEAEAPKVATGSVNRPGRSGVSDGTRNIGLSAANPTSSD
jgi:hypothetical protein